MCIQPTPPIWAECDARSIFKWSKARLNLEFSFSKTGCQTKTKETSLTYYIPIAGEKTDGYMPFQRAFVQNLGIKLKSPIPFPTMITITINTLYIYHKRTGNQGSIPSQVIPKIQKIVLNAPPLLNTQHYKMSQGQVKQSRERSSTFLYILV